MAAWPELLNSTCDHVCWKWPLSAAAFLCLIIAMHSITAHAACRLRLIQSSLSGGYVMQDAARYFQDVLTLDPGDEESAVALDACLADIDAAG